jgi:hypothetical protein
MTKPAGFLAVLFLCACTLGGCEDYEFQFGACDGPTPAPPPDCPAPTPDPDACTGQCLPLAPFDWSVPALLWFGPEAMAPECPADRAKVVAYEGHADLQPPSCFGCSCKAPTGSCERPSVMAAYPNADCTGLPTDFSAPDPWDGMCVIAPMPLEDMRSVLVEPVPMAESGCEPEQHDIPLAGTPKWGTFARACLGNGFTATCPDPSDYCAPTAEPPPEGFLQCVHQSGDRVCPLDYPSKHVFYKDATDLRTCSGCSCGPPQGGVCTMKMSLFQGDSCDSGPNEISSASVNSMTSLCFPIAAGMFLQSKSADEPGYIPGVCEASGGEPVGPVELVEPATFCCQE